MKNYWLDKSVAKDVHWTFEVLDEKKNSLIPETIIAIDERPQLMVIESVEIIEGGKKVWKPVCVVWEKFEATYTDKKFLESHNYIRLLEVNGDAIGILRYYDSDEHEESWIMYNLELTDFDVPDGCICPKPIKTIFTFHHAIYLTESV